MFEGSNKGISRMFQGSWVFHGRLRGWFKGGSRVSKRSSKDFLREFHGSFKYVLRQFQGCLKKVPSVSQGIFKGLNFSWCMALIAATWAEGGFVYKSMSSSTKEWRIKTSLVCVFHVWTVNYFCSHDWFKAAWYLCERHKIKNTSAYIIQGVPKRIGLGFCLISRLQSIGFSNCFFLLETEIHTQILNAKPFLCDIKGLRYLQNKMWFWNRSIHIHIVS